MFLYLQSGERTIDNNQVITVVYLSKLKAWKEKNVSDLYGFVWDKYSDIKKKHPRFSIDYFYFR